MHGYGGVPSGYNHNIHHINPDDFLPSKLLGKSKSGLSTVGITIDNGFKAEKFMKVLFT